MRAIIVTPWDIKRGWDNPGRCTLEWQLARWTVFRERTLRSIRTQTYRDVDGWLVSAPANRELHESLPGYDDIAPFRWVFDKQGESAAQPEPFFACRLDSDDMYGPDAVELMVRESATLSDDERFVQLVTGIAHNESGTLLRWQAKSPPFYGRIWQPGDGMEFGNHSHVWRYSRRIATDQPMFCVTIHGANSTTSDRSSSLGPQLSPTEQAAARHRFGL